MSAARSFRLSGGHVLAGMLAFFITVIAINVAFAVVAVRSFPGEDVRRSYLQGLNYNDTLAARRAQAALGWVARAALVRQGDGAAVEIALSNANGAAISTATLTGELRRPATAHFDQTMQFEHVGDGRYRAFVGAIAPGVWRLRAQAAEHETAVLDFEAELLWPTPP